MELMLKSRKLFQKYVKMSYATKDELQKLIDNFKQCLKSMGNAVQESATIFDYSNLLGQLIAQGLNTKESSFSLIQALVGIDHLQGKLFDTFLEDALNLIYLDQSQQIQLVQLDEQKQYTALCIFTRHLLINKKLGQFFKFGFQIKNCLEQNFYEPESGIFLNSTQNEDLVNFLMAIEMEETTFNISADIRFYKNLSDNHQQYYDNFLKECDSYPKFSYSFKPQVAEMTKIIQSLFGEMTVAQIVGSLEGFGQQLDKILQQKDFINPQYLKRLQENISTQQLQLYSQQIAGMIVFLDDCGAKIKLIKINFAKEINYGPNQYKEMIACFLLSQPKMLSFYVAYLGSLFESGKPSTNCALQKYDPVCVVKSSVACAIISLGMYQRLRETTFLNVGYFGCYYQNFFSELFGQALSNETCGRLLVNSLLEQLLSIYLQKYKTQKNTNVLVFFIAALLIEVREYADSRFVQQFKRSRFPEKEATLKEIQNDSSSDDEQGFRLVFLLLRQRILSKMFDGRVARLVARLENLVTLSDEFMHSDYIQKQRLLIMQVVYQLYHFSLAQIVDQIKVDSEPQEYVVFVQSVYSTSKGFLEQLLRQVNNSYMRDLYLHYEIGPEIELMNFDLKHIFGQIPCEIPSIFNEICILMQQIGKDKNVGDEQMDTFAMNFMIFETTGNACSNIIEIIQKYLDELMPKPTKKGEIVKPNCMLPLYHNMKQAKQYNMLEDQIEAFNRGLLLFNAFSDLLLLLLKFNMNMRNYYTFDAWIVNLEYLRQLIQDTQEINFTTLTFARNAKKLHSSKAFTIEYMEQVQKPTQNIEFVDQKVQEKEQTESNQFGDIVGNEMNMDIDMNLIETAPKQNIEDTVIQDKQQLLGNELDIKKNEINQNIKQEVNECIAPIAPIINETEHKKEPEIESILMQPIEVVEDTSKPKFQISASILKQSPMEIQKQKELELQKQKELEQLSQREQELLKQKEIETQRQKEIEMQKEKEIQKQKEIEVQKQRDLELQKQKELELQKQKELEIQKQKEQELQKQKDLEMQKQKELQLQQQKEKELQEQKELEIQKQKDAELAKQKSQEQILIEQEKQQQINEQRAIQEKQRIEGEKKVKMLKQKYSTVPQTDKPIITISDFSNQNLKLLGSEVESCQLQSLKLIFQQEASFYNFFSKGQTVTIESKQFDPEKFRAFFQLIPEQPLETPIYVCQQCGKDAHLFVRQKTIIPLCSQCVKPTDLNLQQLQLRANFDMFTKAEVKHPQLMMNIIKSIEMLRIIKSYSQLQTCRQLNEDMTQLFPIKNTKMTLMQCVDFIFPPPFAPPPKMKNCVFQFLEKCSKLKNYYMSNPHLPAFQAFGVPFANGNPLAMLAFALTYMLFHIDDHPDCQQKYCASCLQALSTFKYDFQLFEKLASGGKGTGQIAMCCNCLRFCHQNQTCVDGTCRECKNAKGK